MTTWKVTNRALTKTRTLGYGSGVLTSVTEA